MTKSPHKDLNMLIEKMDDLSSLMMKIDSLQTEIFSAGFDETTFLKALSSGVPIDVNNLSKYNDIINYLRSAHAQIHDSASLSDNLLKLKESLIQVPRIKISLSIENPRADFEKDLFLWIKVNVMGRRPYLLDSQYDPSLLGGLVIYLNGHFIDLSLRSKLSDFYRKNMSHVLG